MKLIKYENYQLEISDEAYLIGPIRRLFNKDRSSTKERFFQQMSIIYFMCDPISTYMYIIDPDERLKEILKQEGLPEDFKITKDLQDAMDIYEKHCKTSSTMLLEDTRILIDNLRKYLRSIDFNSKDDKGRPIYPVNQITSAINQIPELVEKLSKAEKAVQKDLEDSSRIRGGAEKKIFEDGIDIK